MASVLNTSTDAAFFVMTEAVAIADLSFHFLLLRHSSLRLHGRLVECRGQHRQRHGLRRFAGFQAGDAIALAANRFNQRAAGPQLAAQIVDVNIDHVGVPRIARAPDPLQQRCARDAAASIEHQVFKQSELAAAQRNGAYLTLLGRCLDRPKSEWKDEVTALLRGGDQIVRDYETRVQTLEAALRLCMRELANINDADQAGSDAVPFCGDDFHEALRAAKLALAGSTQ